MKDIVIIGAGGVGKEVAWIIEQINMVAPTYKILGFIDDDNTKLGLDIIGYKVLGGVDYLKKADYSGSIVIAIASYEIKKSIVTKLKELKVQYPVIIHPNLNLHKSIKIGEGSILYEGSIISPDVEIGKCVIVSPKCGIGHDSIIGDYVTLLWNVNISGNDFIEEGVLFGSGSTIIQGKRVRKESTIGAGAVLVKDVEETGIIIGVPGKKVGYR